MKSWVFGLGSLGVLVLSLSAQAPNVTQYPIQAVPLKDVTLTDGFWKTRLETNRTVTIPHILNQNEKTGRVDNLRKGAGQMPGEYQGRRFNDTDIYKIIEAASYSLATHPDPVLSKSVDDLIALIEKNQQPDGYLFPARTINPAKPAAGIGTERWEYENTGSHETYNSGHLIEAAVAHYAATGKRSLFDVAIKNANLLASVFGPKARQDAPGHEEVELALFRLYRATGDAYHLTGQLPDHEGLQRAMRGAMQDGGLEPADMPVVRSIVRNAAKDDYRLSAIILGVVDSLPFQMRTKLAEPDALAAVARRQ